MGRSPCCAKEGLNRGAWTAMEDKMLTDYIKLHGEGKWRNLPIKAGLKRCGKSCRLRWLNYLKPDIKRGNITRDEEDLIIRLHNLLGNRWSLIAGRLPGRTDNEIKNYWNTNIGKKSTTHHEEHHNYDDHRRRQTTRRHKLSQQRHQKKKKKTPVSSSSHHKKSSTPIIPGAGPIPIAIPSSNVVRTKATRCTKVFIQHTNTIIPDPLNSTSTNHHQQQQHHLPITFPMNHNNTSPQNDIIINHTTTNHPHPQSLNNHAHHPPQPNDDLMMVDLEITDTFLTNVMAMDDTTPPTTDHFSSFNTLNYTNHLHPQDGPPEHNTHILNDDNHDRYLSSSSLSFDDDGFFLKDDDDMMTKMMEAAAQLDDDTNNNNNNWFTAFLGTGDIDFDATHPTD